jgi:subtilisin family serine protease
MSSGRFSPRGRHGRRIAEALVALTIAATLGVLAAPAAAAPSAALRDRLAIAGPSERIAVIATLHRQVDGARYSGRPQALLRALRRTADASQEAVVADIESPVQAFWLVNAVAFTGTPDEVRAVGDDPAVETVGLDMPITLADDGHTEANPFPDAGSGNWGLPAIRAPTVWSTFGLRGAGARVGTIDTGVDASNPDLAGKVIAWHDFVGSSPTPMDDNGHGTHTAGTIAGGSAGGAPIGVAPDARLLVARAMGANGVGSGSALLSAAEWMTDPDGDPATADQPGVVNNSWSASTANDTWFRPMIRRWLELGMVPVFAAGNAGPGAGTIASPAGYPEAIAVGAIDTDGAVPSFSSRGPIVWQNLDELGPVAGTVVAKPDLVAPGVGVVSSVGSGYLTYSGTSMAAPHVAGVAALVRQANPALSPAAVADLLRASAADLGPTGLDPASGAGRVDALRAVELATGPTPETRFTSTPGAATNHEALEYGVSLSNGGQTVRTRVDGGDWSAPTASLTASLSLAEGRHVVEAQALDVAGVADPSPARHAVIVDRTGPRIAIGWRRSGTAAEFRGQVTDLLSGTRRSSIRWSFGQGETARGSRVVRRFPEAHARRVVLTARDAAGNESFALRGFTPRAASAVRGLRVPSVASRRAGGVSVVGRLVRPARLRATLRPIRTSAQTARVGLAASFIAERVGPPVARTVATSGPAGFRLAVAVRGLRPGAYRLEVSAAEPGSRAGSLTIIRRVRIT